MVLSYRFANLADEMWLMRLHCVDQWGPRSSFWTYSPAKKVLANQGGLIDTLQPN
jgi:hypothetical protein